MSLWLTQIKEKDKKGMYLEKKTMTSVISTCLTYNKKEHSNCE